VRRGRIACLSRGEVEGDHTPIPMRHGELGQFTRNGGRPVTKRADDDAPADPGLGRSPLQSADRREEGLVEREAALGIQPR